MIKKCLVILCATLLICASVHAQKINRKALVERHTITINKVDSLSSLSVGNGSFAFTVDVTGLQSFPDAYAKGVPLGTQSEWGWHSFPNLNNYQFKDVLKTYFLNGREISYAVQWGAGTETQKNSAAYFRQNRHRLQLANIGLEILKTNGDKVKIEEIHNINQSLNMWTGEIHSSFSIENIPVSVSTYAHQEMDAIAARIISPLISQGRLQIRIRLPYPTGGWADMGNYWKEEGKHHSEISQLNKHRAVIRHDLDTTSYFISTAWAGNASLQKKEDHYYILNPQGSNSFEFTCRFDKTNQSNALPSFKLTKNNSRQGWLAFWNSGGAIDFDGSSDTRANELERRIILSQYLTKIQCSGNYPPQETGLTYNSWYGRPHLEMHWWHAVHFALWGRTALLEKSLAWYGTVAEKARQIAERQGYAGVRWQKMTDNEGRESPSSVGAFLIWQQPHYIYFSELVYRANPSAAILKKYAPLVFATADFMASFANYDSTSRRYILGKGLIPAQERFKAEDTFNPTYELVYWDWALRTAQKWRERMKLPRNKIWEEVLKKLSPLPVQDYKYLFTENATDSYTNPLYKTDHPAVFGAFGMLPQTPKLNQSLMQNTFDWIWENWNWNDTWGWDFPMTAMTATRLGLPEKALDALLMNIKTNTYLPNGHNYQDDRLTIYLPGNGGLLSAIAMMCAGYDNNKIMNPGIPKNNKWNLRWEGLKKMP